MLAPSLPHTHQVPTHPFPLPPFRFITSLASAHMQLHNSSAGTAVEGLQAALLCAPCAVAVLGSFVEKEGSLLAAVWGMVLVYVKVGGTWLCACVCACVCVCESV